MSISWDDNLTQYLKYSYAYHRGLSHIPYAQCWILINVYACYLYWVSLADDNVFVAG